MKLLTIKEVSEITKVKESTLYSWARKGIIPCHKLNGLLRFEQKEIEEWVKSAKIVPSVINIKPIRNNDIDAIIKRNIESVKR